MRPIPALLMLALAGPLHAGPPAPATVDAALAQAQKAHTPVLLDFSAPWCYSCYFMATHVLNGPQWEALERTTLVVAVDADSPDGSAWMKKLQVKALPAYVVLNEKGQELGRILAEQPREKFYPQIEGIIAGGNTLDGLKRKAASGSNDAIATVLGSYQARDEGREGLDWYATLPKAVQTSANQHAAIVLWLDRLRLSRAAHSKNDVEAVAAAKRVLGGDIGCDRPYVVDQLLAASKKLPKAKREPLLREQRIALDQLLAKDVFIAHPTCADQRSTVIVTADVDAALGDHAAEKALLGRAIDTTRSQLGDNLASDRNLADNLRVYLMRDKREAELDALYPKLIAAYPNDYVYAYRYGKSLLDRGKAAEALPLLSQAANSAYGENRLAVATQRVKALKSLHRDKEAQQVAADALEQNGQWFPEQIAALKAALKS